MLDDLELERYMRHILLREVGGAGQQKLKDAKVLVIGAGGLGAPVLLYLAAAGVGTLGIVDDDTVALSNLQRQIIHKTSNIDVAKTTSARETLREVNPHVKVNLHNCRIVAENALEIISGYDIVVDGSDNFPTRYLMNDACYFARKPLVSAAVGQFDGQITTFRASEVDGDGTPNPNYRCLYPQAPPPGTVPSCEEAGIIGALTGIMGTLQAMEVLKEILGIGTSLVGRLLLFDALSTRWQPVSYKWDEDNALSGRNPTIHDLSIHQ